MNRIKEKRFFIGIIVIACWLFVVTPIVLAGVGPHIIFTQTPLVFSQSFES